MVKEPDPTAVAVVAKVLAGLAAVTPMLPVRKPGGNETVTNCPLDRKVGARNAKVTALPTAKGTAAAMLTETPVTWPPKGPELTAVLGKSCVDWTVTNPPAVGGPVATLLKVHNLAVVSHAVVVVERINCDVPNATEAVSPVPPVQMTVGVEGRKKLDGKLMVIRFAPAAA
jgi:hypothetical protein